MFEHSYTTNRNGTGLGLSIVSRIMDAHGWEIRVDSTEETGTRFRIVTDSR